MTHRKTKTTDMKRVILLL